MKLLKYLLPFSVIFLFGFTVNLPVCDTDDNHFDFKQCSLLAENGNADAMFYIGYMYDEADGVKQDYDKALYWYLQAARLDNVDAQVNLGYMYGQGLGVDQNYQQELFWYEKAASQGDMDAQYNLGVMYEMGMGTPIDYSTALKWYKKAAAQGDTEAEEAILAIEQKIEISNRDN